MRKTARIAFVLYTVSCFFSVPAFSAGLDQAFVVYVIGTEPNRYGTPLNGTDVIIANHKAKTFTTVFKGAARHALFNADAKTIAVRQESRLIIINNNGSNPRTHTPSNWPPNAASRPYDWSYKGKNVFWFQKEGGDLFRYNLDTRQTITIKAIKNFGDSGGKEIYLSADARKAYTTRRALGLLNASLTEISWWDSRNKGCVEGHGNQISGFGKYTFHIGFSHNWIHIIPFNSGKQTCPRETGFWQVEFGRCAYWWGPIQVVNSDDWCVIPYHKDLTAKENGVISYAFLNVVNAKNAPMKLNNNGDPSYYPPEGDDNIIVYAQDPPDKEYLAGNAWVGELPSATNGPELSIDKNALSFSSTTGNTPSTQTVTVTNSGTGTLGTATLATQPADVPWLKLSITDNATNSIKIENAILPGSVSDGVYSATVTVSDPKAPNAVSYTVEFTKGGVAAPTELSGNLEGESLNDVKLTWKDNSQNEDGFIIERKSSGGSFNEITRTESNTLSFTDKGLSLGEHVYRIRAFSGSTFSSYAQEVTVYVVGVPWVKVAPVPSCIKKGSSYTIGWETNRISNIDIYYSIDGGLSWEAITELGGVEIKDDNWGAFVWQAPDTHIDEVVLRVRDYTNHAMFGLSNHFSICDTVAAHVNKLRAERERQNAVDCMIRAAHIELTVNDAGPYSLQLFSSSGRLAGSTEGTGPGTVSLPTTGLSPNLYILRGTVGGKRIMHRLLLQ